jgi:hypothetical protein
MSQHIITVLVPLRMRQPWTAAMLAPQVAGEQAGHFMVGVCQKACL